MFRNIFVLFFSSLLLVTSLPGFALSIAMVVWRGETEAERGFIQGLQELGYEAEVTVYNAEQEKKN